MDDAASAARKLPFGAAEFLERRERALELLRRQGIDIALISAPANYYYLTGVGAQSHYLFVLALRASGEGVWIGRRMEMSNVKAAAGECWVGEGIPIDDGEEPYGRLAAILRDMAGESAAIGIDLQSAAISARGYERLRAALPHGRFIDISGAVEALRAVKSAAELAYMRRAGEIVGTAMAQAIGTIRRGDSDAALAARLIAAAIEQGSEPLSEGPFVTCGRRSFEAHSSWIHAPIAPGEIIDTEMAAVVAHYNTPVFRVSVLGRPSDELRRFHDASLAGLRAGLSGIGPGMASHQADALVRAAIAATGHGDYFTVRAAYGIGIGFPPTWAESHGMSIRPGDQRILEPGMCFHLVPALYKEGLGAVCCSMPIHITEGGVEPLTAIEPKLFVLEG